MDIHQYLNVDMCGTPMSPRSQASQTLSEHNTSQHLIHTISPSLLRGNSSDSQGLSQPLPLLPLVLPKLSRSTALSTIPPFHDNTNRVESVPSLSEPTRLITHHRETTNNLSIFSRNNHIIRSKSDIISSSNYSSRYTPRSRVKSDPSPRHGFDTPYRGDPHDHPGSSNAPGYAANLVIPRQRRSFTSVYPPGLRLKSRVLNSLAQDYRPSVSRSDHISGDDASGADAHAILPDSQPQAVDLVDPYTVHDSLTCDDPECIALCSPLQSIRLVGPTSESVDSDCELPFFANGSEHPSALFQNTVSTAVPISSPVPQNKLPGPFRVVKELQTGAFGRAVAVSESRDTMQPRLLCLKVFKKQTILEKDQLRGLKREFQAYRRLEEVEPLEGFAFLMRLDAVLQDELYIFYAMGLMQFDLALAIDAEVHIEHAGRWLAQTATGIAALHALGIIHRDIKPDNLFIDCQLNIRIGDFGAAYTHDRPVSVTDLGECVSGWVGTEAYLAPEMHYAGHEAYSCAVDYWALGCVAFELLNRKWNVYYLFQDLNTLDDYDKFVQNIGPGYFRSAGISEEAEDLLYGLLEFEPENRFGIAELRSHTYFQREDGTNHFWDIEAKARNRPQFGIVYNVDDVPQDSELPSMLEPKILTSSDIPTDFDEFNWINPSGAWGYR